MPEFGGREAARGQIENRQRHQVCASPRGASYSAGLAIGKGARGGKRGLLTPAHVVAVSEPFSRRRGRHELESCRESRLVVDVVRTERDAEETRRRLDDFRHRDVAAQPPDPVAGGAALESRRVAELGLWQPTRLAEFAGVARLGRRRVRLLLGGADGSRLERIVGQFDVIALRRIVAPAHNVFTQDRPRCTSVTSLSKSDVNVAKIDYRFLLVANSRFGCF